MTGERTVLVPPEYKGSSPMVWPDYRYDTEGWREHADGEGVALIILCDPSSPKILLGRHNSRDSEKHGKWSFLGETRKSGEESGLETLKRGVAEELNQDLSQLEVLAYNPENVLRILEGIPRRSQYYPGKKSFTVGAYTTWTKKNSCGQIGTNEIIETGFFPLIDVLEEKITIPLREYTLPILTELKRGGVLDAPSLHLRPISLPV